MLCVDMSHSCYSSCRYPSMLCCCLYNIFNVCSTRAYSHMIGCRNKVNLNIRCHSCCDWSVCVNISQNTLLAYGSKYLSTVRWQCASVCCDVIGRWQCLWIFIKTFVWIMLKCIVVLLMTSVELLLSNWQQCMYVLIVAAVSLGEPRRRPHRRYELVTLPSVGANP